MLFAPYALYVFHIIVLCTLCTIRFHVHAFSQVRVTEWPPYCKMLHRPRLRYALLVKVHDCQFSFPTGLGFFGVGVSF